MKKKRKKADTAKLRKRKKTATARLRKKIKTITKKLRKWKKADTARLRKWNLIFYRSMSCKTNIKREGIIIIFVIIILSAAIIGSDFYSYNKKTQAAKVAGAQTEITPPAQDASEPAEVVQDNNDNNNDTLDLTDVKKPKPKTVAAPKITNPKATGSSCIKIPANILATLKGAPTPPDGAVKNGKLICDVLAKGEKDRPHDSNKNPKGEWGGCCYDPDEIPNPNCCYPVGSVYEKYLNNYFNNPFPLRK